jgi:hypothetical protein
MSSRLLSLVSNRFVADGIAGHSASLIAARALTETACDLGIAIAFTGSLPFSRDPQSRRELELVAASQYWNVLASAPGFRRGSSAGSIKHAATGVPLRLHAVGAAVLGGPVEWPDPCVEAEMFQGIPVLRLNSFLETEITRALNSPDGPGYANNVAAAIRACGASLDRARELHPYVSTAYQEFWERAQSRRLWPAVA